MLAFRKPGIAPQMRASRTAKERQGQVDVPRQADDAVADKCGTQSAHEELALGADVEQARLETDAHRQTREDVGCRSDQALRDRIDGRASGAGVAAVPTPSPSAWLPRAPEKRAP